MKLFGLNIGGNKPQLNNTPVKSNNQGFAFSTPFMKIGKDNLSLPYVSNYYTNNGIIMFGEDNLYPQLLNQLYYTSPIHSQCIEFISNAVIGSDYTWVDENTDSKETVDRIKFEKINKTKKLFRLLTRDYIIHRRVCVIVKRINGNVVKFERLDPSTIRNNADLNKFTFSSDWSRGFINTKTYSKYSPITNEEETLYVFQDDTPGQTFYPIPSYNSALNWCALDGDLAYFHKNNMQNSIFPSIVIRRPKDFNSVEEVERFKAEISSKTGAGNAGKVLVLTGAGKDELPEFSSITANNNDTAFDVSARETKDSIAIAHGINPSLMGIKVAGSLGNTEEIKNSYIIFEKNVVIPFRNTMEEIFNDLVSIAGIKNTVVINNFQIIEGEIVDKTQTQK